MVQQQVRPWMRMGWLPEQVPLQVRQKLKRRDS
jgi:uncharacterized protein YjhX (UPF0386 family)